MRSARAGIGPPGKTWRVRRQPHSPVPPPSRFVPPCCPSRPCLAAFPFPVLYGAMPSRPLPQLRTSMSAACPSPSRYLSYLCTTKKVEDPISRVLGRSNNNANANAGVVYSNTNNARSNSNTNNGARLCLINSASRHLRRKVYRRSCIGHALAAAVGEGSEPRQQQTPCLESRNISERGLSWASSASESANDRNVPKNVKSKNDAMKCRGSPT